MHIIVGRHKLMKQTIRFITLKYKCWKKIKILITLINEFSQHSSISAIFSTFKHTFLFIKNFLLSLKLSVIICTHSALAIFRRFSKNSLTHKHLSNIQLNNIFCTAGKIQYLFNINTFNNKLSMIINHSFRLLNLTDINLLMNSSASLKLQKRCSFQHTMK